MWLLLVAVAADTLLSLLLVTRHMGIWWGWMKHEGGLYFIVGDSSSLLVGKIVVSSSTSPGDDEETTKNSSMWMLSLLRLILRSWMISKTETILAGGGCVHLFGFSCCSNLACDLLARSMMWLSFFWRVFPSSMDRLILLQSTATAIWRHAVVHMHVPWE